MKEFRFLLIAMFLTILIYTIGVVSVHGWNFLSVFLADITAVNWAGQFNLDFALFVALVGLWIAWRNKFSLLGIGLGLFTYVGGMHFLAAYLLFLSFRPSNRSIKDVLIGEN